MGGNDNGNGNDNDNGNVSSSDDGEPMLSSPENSDDESASNNVFQFTARKFQKVIEDDSPPAAAMRRQGYQHHHRHRHHHRPVDFVEEKLRLMESQDQARDRSCGDYEDSSDDYDDSDDGDDDDGVVEILDTPPHRGGGSQQKPTSTITPLTAPHKTSISVIDVDVDSDDDDNVANASDNAKFVHCLKNASKEVIEVLQRSQLATARLKEAQQYHAEDVHVQVPEPTGLEIPTRTPSIIVNSQPAQRRQPPPPTPAKRLLGKLIRLTCRCQATINGKKQPIDQKIITIHQNESITGLKDKVMAAYSLPSTAHVTLTFDGISLVDLTRTIDSYEMEDDDLFDVAVNILVMTPNASSPASTSSTTSPTTSGILWVGSKDEWTLKTKMGKNKIQEPVVVSPTQEQDELPDEDEVQLLVRLGSVSAKVVGIRYYKGVAHPGEYVTLVREPHNPYDRNAVRVDNLRGEKVGHINREIALPMARIMDQYGKFITIDASIPSIGNTFDLPLELNFYGPEHLESLVQTSFPYVVSRQTQTSRRRGLTDPTIVAHSLMSGNKCPNVVVVNTRSIDWKQAQQQLDDMFAKQVEGQLQNLPDVGTPPSLTSTLLDHQRVAMRWMVQRESPNDDDHVPFYRTTQEYGKIVWLCEITQASQPNKPETVRGGILADDMGLGKTIETIALVLAHPPKGRDYTKTSVSVSSSVRVADDVEVKTLSFSRPTLMDVRKIKLAHLEAVLLAANLTIPSDGKMADLVETVMAALDSGNLSPELYHTTLQQQTQEGKIPSSPTTMGCNTTLIVCPVSVMSNWQRQIDQHVAPRTLRVAVYHGTDRRKFIDELDQIDVLIASYGTLQTDYINYLCQRDKVTEPVAKRIKQNSIFHANFYRVVLDEAHIIRNPKSRTFQACNSVQAIHRWCLTGTPLQNKPEDIQSLWQFLRVPPLGDPHVFRRAISQPIKEGQDEGLSRLRAMMAHVALRRNKDMVSIQMAPKDIQIRSVVAPSESRHQQIHDALFRSAKLAFSATLQDGDERALSQTAHVFEVLTRLRQACCSGSLVPKERLQRAEDVLRTINAKQHLSVEEGLKLLEKLKGALEQEEDDPPDCAVCLEPLTETAAVALRACGHVFCQDCIGRVARTSGHCPFCRQSFGKGETVAWSAASKAVKIPNDHGETGSALSQQIDELGPSPKMEALIVALGEIQPGDKAVIFSQFTKFLDLIQNFLVSFGYSVTRIDGKMTASQRLDALAAFSQEEDGPTIMLCSLHAAGTGINLTRANHVFMMDTWFNLSVEQQAMDRVHRIGQTRPVRILRFVTADSVESRMLSLQEAKAALGKGAFENLNADEKKKARLADVKKLLQLCGE